jgi:hypothetical protein
MKLDIRSSKKEEVGRGTMKKSRTNGSNITGNLLMTQLNMFLGKGPGLAHLYYLQSSVNLGQILGHWAS